MKNQFSLDIKTPCTENFSEFTPTTKGGFCSSCVKEVVDFTTMNTKEISLYFQNNTTQKTCGRFNSQQLSIPIKSYKNNKYLGFFTGISLTILSFFSIITAQAQNLEKTTNTIEPKREAKLNIDTITVEGIITTKDDGLPLPGASVVLQGTSVGCQTDFDGKFKFPEKLKKGDVLIISYVGMQSQKVIIENKKSASKIALKLDMSFDSCIIMGEVAVKKIFASKGN